MNKPVINNAALKILRKKNFKQNIATCLSRMVMPELCEISQSRLHIDGMLRDHKFNACFSHAGIEFTFFHNITMEPHLWFRLDTPGVAALARRLLRERNGLFECTRGDLMLCMLVSNEQLELAIKCANTGGLLASFKCNPADEQKLADYLIKCSNIIQNQAAGLLEKPTFGLDDL